MQMKVLHRFMSRFWSIVLWVKYSSAGLNTVIHGSIWRCMAVLIKWQHHNCTLSLTNGLCHYNVVSGGVPFHPYNTQEDIVECSSRTSECPPISALRESLALNQSVRSLNLSQICLHVNLQCQIEFSWTATLLWRMWLCDPIPCAEVSECVSYNHVEKSQLPLAMNMDEQSCHQCCAGAWECQADWLYCCCCCCCCWWLGQGMLNQGRL